MDVTAERAGATVCLQKSGYSIGGSRECRHVGARAAGEWGGR